MRALDTHAAPHAPAPVPDAPASADPEVEPGEPPAAQPPAGELAPDELPAGDAQVPSPPSERGPWLIACALGVLGVAVLVAVLTGAIGTSASAVPAASPPAVPVVAATPAPGVTGPAGPRAASTAGSSIAHAPIVDQPSIEQQRIDAARFVEPTTTHISIRWMEGFYPIYAIAEETFGVNWLLLASIHRQETAFSTAPSTYYGLNFAGCCGGPMQFNVKNGPVSTWQLVSDSYVYGKRPASYDHMTATHPSIYDDFDSIMAAAHLLSADGAEYALDGAAWDAAYDYYGHDPTGVTYADQVLARAIGWSQHGFCINCGVETAMIEAVQAAYGAPVLAALEAEARQAASAVPASPSAPPAPKKPATVRKQPTAARKQPTTAQAPRAPTHPAPGRRSVKRPASAGSLSESVVRPIGP